MPFLSLAALTRFVGIKVKVLRENFALKKRDKTPPGRLPITAFSGN